MRISPQSPYTRNNYRCGSAPFPLGGQQSRTLSHHLIGTSGKQRHSLPRILRPPHSGGLSRCVPHLRLSLKRDPPVHPFQMSDSLRETPLYGDQTVLQPELNTSAGSLCCGSTHTRTRRTRLRRLNRGFSNTFFSTTGLDPVANCVPRTVQPPHPEHAAPVSHTRDRIQGLNQRASYLRSPLLTICESIFRGVQCTLPCTPSNPLQLPPVIVDLHTGILSLAPHPFRLLLNTGVVLRCVSLHQEIGICNSASNSPNHYMRSNYLKRPTDRPNTVRGPA